MSGRPPAETGGIRWIRAKPGTYYAVVRPWQSQQVFSLEIAKTDAGWRLRIDGVDRGSFGRLTSAKMRAVELVDAEATNGR